MNKDIIKGLKTCVALVVIVVVIDILFGQLMSFYAKRYGLPGDYAKIEYMFKQSQDDVVIIGSSVAINSFMPSLMMDSMQMSVFNGGCNAQNIIFFRCMVEGLLQHHRPRGIILVLQPDDLSDKQLGRIELLNPYYGQGAAFLDSVLLLQNEGKRSVFLHSNLYKYNTVWFRILLQSMLPKEEMANYGFVAKHKPNNLPVFEDNGDLPDNKDLFPLKVQCLKDIISHTRAEGVELLVVFPPYFKRLINQGNPYSKQMIEAICRENGVPVIDDNQMAYFRDKPQLFYDTQHLNGDGARIYTGLFIDQLLKSDFYQKIKKPKNDTLRAN